MKLAEVFNTIAGPDAPVEFVAFDGSKAGTPVRPCALRCARLAQSK